MTPKTRPKSMHPSLAQFQPNRPTDLSQIAELLRKRPGEISSLPSCLPDEVLISVARDLRAIEIPHLVDDHSLITAPLLLVLDLHMKVRSRPKEKLQISEETMHSTMRAYQWAVEREIVARAIGADSSEDEKTLVKAIRHEI